MPLTKVSQHSLGNSAVTTAKLNLTAPLGIANSTANVIFMAANGNIGVGTSTPASLLDITGNDPTLRFTDNAGSPAGTWSIRSNDGLLSFRDVTNGADRVVIGNTGLVGIGTNSPANALTVTGGAGDGALIYSAGSTAGGTLFLRNTQSSNYTWRMAVGGGDDAWVGGRGFFIRDDTAGSTRFVISTNGNIGVNVLSPSFQISTGSDHGIQTGRYIHRLGSGSGASENIEYGGAFYLYHDGRTCSTPGFGNIAVNRSGPAFSCRNNGGGAAYYAEAGGFTGPSDYRLKENIVPITDGIARVKQLNPIVFDYTDEAHWEDGNARHDGFLAHEVKEVVADAVVGEKDAVDEDGKMIIQALDKSRLVPLLTAALKDAIDKIEILEAKVAALEGNA